MSAGESTITTFTASTDVGTSGTSVPIAPHFNTLSGDLIVCWLYTTGVDPTLTVDAGDGWRQVCGGYSGSYGLALFVLNARRASNGGYAGLTLAAGVTGFRAVTQVFRCSSPFRLDASQAVGSPDWYQSAASSVTSSAPETSTPYAQCLDVVCRAYNSAGGATTSGTISGFTESNDGTGAAPNIGGSINWQLLAGHQVLPLVSSSLSVARTDHAGLRVVVPLVGNTLGQYGRYLSGRRIA